MNQQEWVEFAKDFQTRFPTEGAWLKNRPDTFKLWYRDIFSGLSLQDCLEVSKLVFSGTKTFWDRYEQVPSIYMREVGVMRVKRRERSAEMDRRHRETLIKKGGIVQSDAKMGRTFRRMRQAACPEDAQRILNEEFPDE